MFKAMDLQLTFSYPCFFHLAIKFASAYLFFNSQS